MAQTKLLFSSLNNILDASCENHTMKKIDSLFEQTQDEYLRTRYVANLQNHAMMNLRFDVRNAYEKSVRPEFERENGRSPETGHEIYKAIGNNLFFRSYSSIRYNAQEMMPRSKQAAVERNLQQMIDAARDIAIENPAGGTLKTDSDLEMPSYITAVDVHLTPGGYHTEFTKDDVAQGILLGSGHAGPPINPGRVFGSVGHSISPWLKHTFPDFSPSNILDLGTQGGSNLIAYGKEFPGLELHGIDIAAPSLRYGHAKAEQAGVKMHLSQQNAEKLDYPDSSFDLVVSSFFLHEVAVPATRRIIAEAFRVLRSNGIMINLELPPHKSCEPFIDFLFDWDCNHNNEPNFRNFRSQDPTNLLIESGFSDDSTFEKTIPDVATFSKEQYADLLSGNTETPLHGRGGWFVFGGKKN